MLRNTVLGVILAQSFFVPAKVQAELLAQSKSLVDVGWEQNLFPGLTLERETVNLDDTARASVTSVYGVEPLSMPFDVYFARQCF